MARLYIYVVKSSPDPDHMHACGVPELLNANEIFFGPCKKRLRGALHSEFLRDDKEAIVPTEDIYVVGVNAANAKKRRGIIWAGRVLQVMTFAAAHRYVASTFARPLTGEFPTLHVEPICKEGKIIGYRHRTSFHGEEWVLDLVDTWPSPVSQTERRANDLRLKPGASMSAAFPRDACLLLSNILFANGQGIPIDDDLVSLLEAEQPEAREVGSYAIFGRRRNGSANGLTGSYLCISDCRRVDQFITWLGSRLPTAETQGALVPTVRMQTGETCADTKRSTMAKQRKGC